MIKMNSYIEHAKREFEILNWPKDNEMQKVVCDDINKLLETFSKQEHSGSSAPYVINLFKDLALFKPISPLTGENNEWNEVENGNGGKLYQNNRCSHVFKDENGRAYDINGKVFRDKDGCCYTNGDSHVDIEFPYVPKIEYIDVDD